MRIKVATSATRSITYRGEVVDFDKKGFGTISTKNGEDLIASNFNFTKVHTTKKEASDAE